MPSYPWFLIVAFVAMAIAMVAPMAWRWRHGMGWRAKVVNGILGSVWVALVVLFPTLGGAVHFYAVSWEDGSHVWAVESSRSWNLWSRGNSQRIGKSRLALLLSPGEIELNDMREIGGHADKLKATPQQVALAAKVIAGEYDFYEGLRHGDPVALESLSPSEIQKKRLEAWTDADVRWSAGGSVGKRPSDEVPELEKWRMSSMGEGHSFESLTMAVIIALAAFLAIWNGWPWLASKFKKQ